VLSSAGFHRSMRIGQANLMTPPRAPHLPVQPIRFSSEHQKFNRNILKYPYIGDPVAASHAVR
jgi:hypothetical protein